MDNTTTTWRKELESKMKDNNDDFSNIVKMVPEDLNLDEEFDWGYGLPEGKPFIIWTEKYIYFPVTYDGIEWVESLPRNPTKNLEPRHFGSY